MERDYSSSMKLWVRAIKRNLTIQSKFHCRNKLWNSFPHDTDNRIVNEFKKQLNTVVKKKIPIDTIVDSPNSLSWRTTQLEAVRRGWQQTLILQEKSAFWEQILCNCGCRYEKHYYLSSATHENKSYCQISLLLEQTSRGKRCRRELKYTHTHTHRCSALNSSVDLEKLIETTYYETQFASAMFSIRAPSTNTAHLQLLLNCDTSVLTKVMHLQPFNSHLRSHTFLCLSCLT